MMPSPGARLKLIACEILYREACKLAAESPFQIDVVFNRKGLHDLETADMLSRLQAAVDAADAERRYEAILLGYARCNDGVAGLTARSIPLVIPKAHDCITLFFGGRSAYQGYFDAHPGTYFHTTGWRERNCADVDGTPGVMARLGLDLTDDQLVARYGQENAEMIRQTLGDGLRHYDRICYLRMGVTDERAFIESSRQEAADRGWSFDLRLGDWTLLRKLFNGPWDADFVIVPPGGRLAPRNDRDILGAG